VWSARLEFELLRWRVAGHRARLWWRDDDATERSAALFRLFSLSNSAAVPLTLAVIPSGDMAGLAKALAVGEQVTVAQHGVDHQNRRTGPVAGEFPQDWTRDAVKAKLSWGWDRVRALPGIMPVFVPPWNDVHPELDAALVDLGFRALSASGELQSGELVRLDVHLDLMRWRGGARFRGQRRFLRALFEALRLRRRLRLWTAPIGLLTHHLAHDEAAWKFLHEFLAWTERRTALGWVGLASLLEGVESRAPTPYLPALALVSSSGRPN